MSGSGSSSPDAAEATAGGSSGSSERPAAIAVSPILSARYRERDLERIHAAAPGARIVHVSLEGLADGDLSDVEAFLRGPMPAAVFDRVLARCHRLTWVHSATAGVERVLTPAARERGLTITNARGVFSRPIAEYVLTMILAISRRLPHLLELQRERTWQPLEAVELRDVTIGIVGLGSIGGAVAELAVPFGCRILATRRRASGGPGARAAREANAEPLAGEGEAGRDVQAAPAERGIEVLPADRLPDLLTASDFVVLALPLTPETEDLFDGQTLGRMKRTAWLINIARGALVDERALARALREGMIGGAVLDAFREEPLPSDSALYELPNLIITPHTAWSSGRVLDGSIELFCTNLERFRRGEPLLNVVDPERGY
ncbi:MAG TPA: D-2-hydroxyacid dehydrogenase [Candidatus Limnocylindrales bacterium]|nr:D-2-hydroxyacid dehydrogenase [Candidatus Limnocylindrales bacterium]